MEEGRNLVTELGVGDGWEGEIIRRSKLGVGHEVGMMRGCELGRRSEGEIGGIMGLI